MVYGTLGMLIRALGPQYSRLRPKLYLVVLCLADLVAIASLRSGVGWRNAPLMRGELQVVQAVGGAMAALALQANKASSNGTHIMGEFPLSSQARAF